MNVSIRSYVSSGIAVVSVAGFVAVPATSAEVAVRNGHPPVALAATVRPLVAQLPVLPALAPATPTSTPRVVTGLLNEQVVFHVDLAVDFITQGAELISHQLPVPGTLLRDIANGTPLPVAVGRALKTLTDVEIDAGGRLVGFAMRYVDFQLQFAAAVLQDTIGAAMPKPAAIGTLTMARVAAAGSKSGLADTFANDSTVDAVEQSVDATKRDGAMDSGITASAASEATTVRHKSDRAAVHDNVAQSDESDAAVTPTRHSVRVVRRSEADKTTALHADSPEPRTQVSAPTAPRDDPAGPAE
jgi:hypothetical protein